MASPFILPAIPTYDPQSPNGGDSLTSNLNIFKSGHIAWMLTSIALVWIMIPAVGFFYAGLSRRNHSLALIWQAFAAISVISFQWFVCGYSLAFSHTAGKFIGDLENVAMRNVLGAPSVGSAVIPDVLFMLFQCTFAIATGVIMIGAAAERGRLMPSMLFLFLWTTIVYDPIACWTWNPSGWIYVMGGYDFAGGGPVHMTSGAGALAYSLMLGKRRAGESGRRRMPRYEPSSTLLVILGTLLLWFGWFGFNGGSALGSTIRAVYATANTNLAAACSSFTWMLLDYYKNDKKKWSIVSICQGAVTGLVGITPAAGFVPLWAALLIGISTATCSNLAMSLKDLLQIDDGLDVFAIHGIGGLVGSLLTGIFAADYIIPLDAMSSGRGGWITGHYMQIVYQLAGSIAILSWSFTVSMMILWVMNQIPGLELRLKEQEELDGVDVVEIGEELWPLPIQRSPVDSPSAAKASEHRHPTSPFELGEYTGSRRDLSDRNRDVLHLEDRGRHRIAEAI